MMKHPIDKIFCEFCECELTWDKTREEYDVYSFVLVTRNERKKAQDQQFYTTLCADCCYRMTSKIGWECCAIIGERQSRQGHAERKKEWALAYNLNYPFMKYNGEENYAKERRLFNQKFDKHFIKKFDKFKKKHIKRRGKKLYEKF